MTGLQDGSRGGNVSAQPGNVKAASALVTDALLSVTGLTKHFPVTRGIILRHRVGLVRSVEDVSFSVKAGETLGIVGESGCGKTTTARMIVRLIEPTAGKIMFDGHDITHLRQGAMRPLRREVQMIFQDPFSSLNPRHTVGTIVGAPFRLQKVKTEKGTRQSVQELLELVGLNPEHYNRYPHEFSGGQRQRIGIARTLALRPKLIVADEPVSALDVSIQAQVINLLGDLQAELGLTYVIIAHDLSVIRHVCDRVAVMYLGNLVELASRDDLYARPRHPYTVGLIRCIPRGGASGDSTRPSCWRRGSCVRCKRKRGGRTCAGKSAACAAAGRRRRRPASAFPRAGRTCAGCSRWSGRREWKAAGCS